MNRKYLDKFCLTGALTGFLVLHPLVMLLSYFMNTDNVAGKPFDLQSIIAQVKMSFNPAMLPWSLSFVLFSGVICYYYGKIKQADKEKEKLIESLQKALAEVKILSGLLPICASCKKIRDDQGYWQQIEEYVRDHSEADFTHGICNDCVKDLYPEFYPKFIEKVEKNNWKG
ncbi:MAG: hypothetical protein QNK14_00410 [Desulfobacterales bacterium]|nr:hypothetical protein [Desulfobacterales bacterium]